MPADLSPYKVVKGEQPSSTKFDNFVQASQDDINALGDTTKSGFAGFPWLDPTSLKTAGAVGTNVLSWNGSAWVPVAAPPGSAFTLITDTVLGAPANSFDFTSIAGTFKHLWLAGYVRTDTAGGADDINIRLNNDSGSNYDGYTVTVQSSPASFAGTENLAATSVVWKNAAVADSSTAGMFTSFECWIPHYAGTTNNKVVTGLSVRKQTVSPGDLRLGWLEGNWRSNSAITRVTLSPAPTQNFKIGSRVILAGVS